MVLPKQTEFPSFGLGPNSPDLEETSVSDASDNEEDNVGKREAQYKSKEDQDVAVFMALAQQMSLNSLKHLLQGHARACALPDNCIEHTAVGISCMANSASSSDLQGQDVHQLPTRAKQFRFAEVRGGKAVRCVIHEIESIKSMSELWFSDQEMSNIRQSAIKDVKWYRKHRHDYISNVEKLVTHASEEQQKALNLENDGDNKENNIDKEAEGMDVPPVPTSTLSSSQKLMPNNEIEELMKKFMQDSYSRGLEVHICNMLAELRRETVVAVLEEQAECKACGDSYDITAESLRMQSLAYTEQSRSFAKKLAQW